MTRACLILNGEHFRTRGRVYGWGKLKRVALSADTDNCQVDKLLSFLQENIALSLSLSVQVDKQYHFELKIYIHVA